MELTQALQFTYTSVAQEIVCATDAMADLCGTLDRLGAHTAMIICGPSILRSSNVIGRIQEALGARCVGLFAGVAPHAPVPTLAEPILRVLREAW
jgi:maleylacetate reductase